MKFLSSLLFLLCALQSHSQTSVETADSLLDNYYASLPNDTEKVNRLYKTGFELRTKAISVAFQYAEACLQSATESRSDLHIAKAHNLLGVLYFRTGQMEKALEHHEMALKLRENLKDNEGIAMSNMNIANVYSGQNRKEEACALYREALQLFTKTGNKKQLANCYNNIGNIYFEKTKFTDAAGYYNQALKIGEELNDYELKAFTYNNLGAVAENLKDYKQAQVFFEEAMELRELMDNEIEQVDTYINLASVSFEQKEVQKAKSLLYTALNISHANNYAEGNLSIYNFLRDIYSAEGKKDSAELYQKKHDALKARIEKSSTKGFEHIAPAENQAALTGFSGQNHLPGYIIGLLAAILVILFVVIKRGK